MLMMLIMLVVDYVARCARYVRTTIMQVAVMSECHNGGTIPLAVVGVRSSQV